MDTLKFVQNQEQLDNLEKLNKGQKYKKEENLIEIQAENVVFVEDISLKRKIVAGTAIAVMTIVYAYSFGLFLADFGKVK